MIAGAADSQAIPVITEGVFLFASQQDAGMEPEAIYFTFIHKVKTWSDLIHSFSSQEIAQHVIPCKMVNCRFYTLVLVRFTQALEVLEDRFCYLWTESDLQVFMLS